MGLDILAKAQNEHKQAEMEKEMIVALGWCEPRHSHIKSWLDTLADLTGQDAQYFWTAHPEYDATSVRDLLGHARVRCDMLKGRDLGQHPTVDTEEIVMITWLEIACTYDASIYAC